jgi:hypothetical protein
VSEPRHSDAGSPGVNASCYTIAMPICCCALPSFPQSGAKHKQEADWNSRIAAALTQIQPAKGAICLPPPNSATIILYCVRVLPLLLQLNRNLHLQFHLPIWP